MNHHPDRRDHPRPSWPRMARAAAVMTGMASAALLAAACSGSPSSTGAGGSQSAQGSSGVAYSECMRSHGVPNFPDPGHDGQIPKAAAISALREVSDSRAKAVSGTCANLNPAGETSPALTVQQQQDYLRAAACMRSHGLTSFPDPTFSGGSVHFPIPSSIDTSSQQFTQARQTCARLIPAGLPYSGSNG